MGVCTRYAAYVAPPPGPLADFAAGWLGWDPAASVVRDHIRIPGLPRPVEDLTATPRKFGFHATLKPPFRLAERSHRRELEADFAALAARLPAVTLDGLELSRLGGFLALTPVGDAEALRSLSAEVLAGLDHHRAPATEAELARRRAAGLTANQAVHLRRWGYPYVMDEFRFHFTLTGALSDADAAATAAALAPIITPLLPRPFVIDSLCLFGEAGDEKFHRLGRYPLAG